MTNEVQLIERLVVLETQIKRLEGIEEKLDSLLHLRSRGLGAFWLSASLFGTGIIGAALSLFVWLKDHITIV